MTSIFRHGLHIAYKQIVILLLIVVLVSSVYGGITYWLSAEVDKRQDEVAAWLSDKLGHTVTIESVSLHWSGLNPKLQFVSLKVFARDRKKALFYFESGYVGIDLLVSILERDIALSSISLTNVDLAISRNAAGKINVRGFNLASALPSASGKVDWPKLLSLPGRFDLKKVTIDYKDDDHDELSGRYQLHDVSAQHDHTKWTLAGYLKLPMALGDDITFQAEADIDGHPKTANWRFQLGVDDLRWQQLPTEFSWQNVRIQEGRINATVSGSGLGKRIDTIDADVKLLATLASFKHDNQRTVPVEGLSGVFKWQRQKHGLWQLSANKLQLIINGDRWPATDFMIAGDDDEWSITGSYARLSDLTAISLLTGHAPDYIFYHQPAGDIDTFFVRYSNKNGLVALRFNLQDGALLPWQDVPGISGLTMALNWYQDGIDIDIDSHNITFSPQSWLDNAVFFDTVKGTVTLQKQDNNWLVKSPAFQVWNDDFLLRLAGSIEQQADGKRYADLTLNMEDVEVSKWQSYVPSTLLPDKFSNWASKAFVAGRIAQGKVVVRGDLAALPYVKSSQQGVLDMALQMEDVQLHYAPKWPDLFNVNGMVTWQDDAITIKSKTGHIAGFDFSAVTAHISLAEKTPVLQLKGDIKGTTHHALQFLADSPLAQRFGSIAKKAKAQGDTDISLNLRMPLTSPVSVDVTGMVRFIDSQLYSTSLADVGLSLINGDMQFTNNGISAQKITAHFLAEPVVINVSSQPTATNLSMTGKLVTEKINTIWPGRVPAYISGETDYRVDVAVIEKEKGNFYADIDLSSDLVGLTIATPAPTNKAKQKPKPFHLTAKRLDNNLLYSVRLGDVINIALLNDSKLWRGEIRFGTGQAEVPESGIKVRGRLPTLSLDDWRQWLGAKADATKDNQWLTAVNDIAVDVDVFSGFDQTLTALTIVAKKSDKRWRMRIDSDKLKGSVSLPFNPDNDSVLKVDLEKAYLYLPKKDAQALTPKVPTPPALWPPMEVNIGALKINDIVLGEFYTKAKREALSWVLDEAYLSSDIFSASVSTGSWSRLPAGDESQVELSLKSNDLARLLANFGYQQTIESNALSLDINLAWKNNPLAISASNITGTLNADIGKGNLKEINPNAAERIFGLLSVVTLPRRLSLDFSDLFAKGFNFDSISGSFKITDHTALTDDLVLKSAPATINISGPVDIVKRRYDQKVKITPNIASTLPVAGFVFGPAGSLAGTAILLFDKLTDRILGKDLVNRISYNYHLTGTWDDPKLSVAKPTGSP